MKMAEPKKVQQQGMELLHMLLSSHSWDCGKSFCLHFCCFLKIIRGLSFWWSYQRFCFPFEFSHFPFPSCLWVLIACCPRFFQPYRFSVGLLAVRLCFCVDFLRSSSDFQRRFHPGTVDCPQLLHGSSQNSYCKSHLQTSKATCAEAKTPCTAATKTKQQKN